MGSGNHGIMESWSHGITESWNHGIMESWSHGIMESWRRPEAPRRNQEAPRRPRRRPEASRRHPGGTQEAPTGTQRRQGGAQEARGNLEANVLKTIEFYRRKWRARPFRVDGSDPTLTMSATCAQKFAGELGAGRPGLQADPWIS